jgi:hypothetical protein
MKVGEIYVLEERILEPTETALGGRAATDRT